MDERDRSWPLMIFTVLGPATVGCLLALLLLGGNGEAEASGFRARAGAVNLFLAAVAVGASLAHVQKPLRAYRALRGFPRSELSREIVLFSAYLVLLMAGLVLEAAGAGPWLWVAALVAGGAVVWTTAQVYRLPARPSWCHWSTLATFSSGGLALGAAFALSLALVWLPSASVLLVAGLRVVIAVSIVASALATWRRVAYLRATNPDTRATYHLIRAGYRGLWQARLLVGYALPLLLVGLAWRSEAVIVPAAAALLLGELLDRRLFFAGAVPLSFRSEVQGAGR